MTKDTLEIPVLVKRRLQAQVIGPIHAEMVAVLGRETADAIIDSAIRKAAIAEGKAFASWCMGGLPGQRNSSTPNTASQTRRRKCQYTAQSERLWRRSMSSAPPAKRSAARPRT